MSCPFMSGEKLTLRKLNTKLQMFEEKGKRWRRRGGSQVERRKLFNVNSVDSAIVLFYRMQIETSLLSTNSQLWDLK